MKVKVESEKVGLKLNIQKTKIMVPGPISSVQFSSVAQSCLNLCDPMNYTVHEILQARVPEWVAFPFSRDRTQVFHIAGGFFTI